MVPMGSLKTCFCTFGMVCTLWLLYSTSSQQVVSVSLTGVLGSTGKQSSLTGGRGGAWTPVSVIAFQKQEMYCLGKLVSSFRLLSLTCHIKSSSSKLSFEFSAAIWKLCKLSVSYWTRQDSYSPFGFEKKVGGIKLRTWQGCPLLRLRWLLSSALQFNPLTCLVNITLV